jgi:hypothetical protein
MPARVGFGHFARKNDQPRGGNDATIRLSFGSDEAAAEGS